MNYNIGHGIYKIMKTVRQCLKYCLQSADADIVFGVLLVGPGINYNEELYMKEFNKIIKKI